MKRTTTQDSVSENTVGEKYHPMILSSSGSLTKRYSLCVLLSFVKSSYKRTNCGDRSETFTSARHCWWQITYWDWEKMLEFSSMMLRMPPPYHNFHYVYSNWNKSNQEDAAAVLDFCIHVHRVVDVCHAWAVHGRCALGCAVEMQTLHLPTVNKQHPVSIRCNTI